MVTRGDGAQDCPDAARLAEQVRAVAGVDMVSVGLATPMETWVQVSIARSFGSYTAQISALGAHHGTRTLEDLGPSCTSLADAVAVTIAIFLDPYQNVPLPEPRALALPRSAAQATPAREPSSAERPARFPQLLVNGAGGVSLALLEHSQPFLNASVGIGLTSRWSFTLGGAYLLPDTKTASGGQIDFSLSYLQLTACVRAWGAPDSARLAWCAGPLYGSFAGSGKAYREIHSDRSAWFALALGPEAVLPFSRGLSWVVTAQAVTPLIAQNFVVQAAGERSTAFRTASVGGLLSLGVRGAL